MLNEQRLAQLKKLAAEEQRTMSELVDEILRIGIQQRCNKKKMRVNSDLPHFAMGAPTTNVADRDQLEELMKE